MGKTVSSISGSCKNWTVTLKRMTLKIFLTIYTKIKWIKDLNVRLDIINLLEETGRTL